jgi:hypothetical protein
LIGRYPGADGMKTGFTCPAGFNVVATAERGGRRLIVVVFGSPSAHERTNEAALLFDRGFAMSSTGAKLETLSSDARSAVAPRSRAADTLVLGLVALGGAVMAAVMAGRAPGAPSTDQALYRLAAATCLLFTLCAGPLYLSLNPWLDLGRVATRLSTVAGGPVQLVAPDETTEAMAELYLPHRADAASAPEIVWPLVQVADRRSWKVRDWQVFLGYRPSPGATAPPVLPPRAGYRPACVLERPGGRTYALYGPVAAVGSASASRCRAAMGEVPADDGAG